MPRKPDSFRDAEDFASSLTTRQLHCRELGHEWRDDRVSYDPKSKSYDRALMCRNCRTIRRQVLDRRGHVVTNSYKYPPGYLATQVEDRASLSRDVFRVEAITRWLTTHQDKAAS
jgi:hypothetical protein